MERVHLWRDTEEGRITILFLGLEMKAELLSPRREQRESVAGPLTPPGEVSNKRTSVHSRSTTFQNLQNGHARLLGQADTCVPLVICFPRHKRGHANTLACHMRTKHVG